MGRHDEGGTHSPGCETGDTVRLEVDTVFELLADSRRRAVIEYFTDDGNPEPADFACLAQFVFEAEYEPEEPVSKSEIRSLLHHTHLPKLADAGVVDYDREKMTISYHGTERIERPLRVARGR